MDNMLFSKYFFFTQISRRNDYHTDNSSGIRCNYIGRMLDGRGRIESDGEGSMELLPGDVFYFPFGLKYHSYWSVGDGGGVRFESYRFDFYPSDGERRFCMQKLHPTEEALRRLDSIAAEMRVDAGSVGQLLLFFHSVMPSMLLSDPDRNLALFNRASEYISEHSDFKVPELARFLGMSESGVYSLFRGFKTTPVAVKKEIVVERAAALLAATDMTVEEICDSVGICSGAYFRKLIYSVYGKTPSEIRRERRAALCL